MSKFKSLFLKIAMATIVCLVASFSFVLINNKNTNINQTLNTTANEPVVNVSTDNGISLNWRKDVTPQTEQITDTYGNSNKNVQALGSGVTKKEPEYYSIDPSKVPNPIYGGTTISCSYSDSQTINDVTYYLSATVSFGGNSTDSATFTAKGGYAIVGFMFGNTNNNGGDSVNWKYYTLVQNTNTNEIKNGPIAGSSEIHSSLTPEDIDPSYNGTLVFKALVIKIKYTINAYYRHNDSDGYSLYKPNKDNNYTVAYTLLDKNQNPYDFPTSPNIDKNELSFGRWMFNVDDAENKGYSCKFSDNTQILTVIGDNLSLTFGGVTQNPYHKNLYYVSNVSGYGQLDQSSTNPIITAKWSTKYNLKIKISDADKKDIKTDTTVHSNTDTLEDKFETELIIQDNNSYAYPFMSSEKTIEGKTVGLSFMKYDDFDNNPSYRAMVGSNWYFVHRYGYYITGYKLSYTDALDKTIYLYYSSENGWSSGEVEDFISIESLQKAKDAFGENLSGLALFAEQVDERSGTNIIHNITMEPVWAPVNIKIDNGKTTTTTTYTNTADRYENDVYIDRYSINDTGITSAGQTLACYQYIEGDDNTLISTYGLWNYKNIPYNTSTENGKTNGYVYSKNSTDIPDKEKNIIGARYYYLNVTPVFLDNIYEVTLTGAKENATDIYKLYYPNGFDLLEDYQFNTSSGNASNNASNLKKTITFENCPFYDKDWFNWSDWSDKNIDGYIVYLKKWKDTYIKGINVDGTDDFDIFRKVFHNGTAGADEDADNYDYQGNTYTCQNKLTTTNGKMWIYLANNQPTGNLPVFETSYQELIFWENYFPITTDSSSNNYNKFYAYPTHAYDPTYHKEDLNKFITHKVKNNNGQDTDILNIWKFSDGYVSGNNTSTLNAHYFRKNHKLDIHTIVDSVGVGRYGYVKVDIVDTTTDADKNGKYIVIYNGSKMTVYKLPDSVQNLSTYSITNGLGNEIEGDFIYYEGCDITITVVDQSKDTNAMVTGNYDDMIGFKFSTITQNTLKDFLDKDKNKDSNEDPYIYAFKAQNISNLKYTNGSTIDLDVEYEPIQYTFEIKIDDENAGEINVDINGVIDKANKEFELSNVNVLGENKYNIFAWMFAGYTLQDNAFTLSNGSILKTYDDSIENTQENQNYSIKAGKGYFYGDWLREYFYNTREDYSVSVNVNGVDETLTINTKPIVFNYGLKIYNSYNNTSGEMEDVLLTITKEDGTVEDVTISLTNGVAYTNTVGSHLNPIKDDKGEIIADAGYIYSLNTVDYALLSSRLYLPRNPLTTSNNGYRTYDFILNKKPTYTYTINKDLIPSLVENYKGNGLIISPENNNRTIYLMLEVRELLEITVNTENTFNDNDVSIDTNSTTRTATIENGTNNSKTLTLGRDSDFTETTTIYSYQGLENFVNFKYDEKRYKGVRYQFGKESEKNLEASSLKFESNCNTKLTVRFDPKPLTVEMKYINAAGEVVARSGMDEYIAAETLPVIPGEYYIPDYVYYSVTAKHNNYDLELSVNEIPMGTTYNTDRTVYTSHSKNEGIANKDGHDVSDYDYDFEKIEILVKVIEKNNSVLNIRYLLQDSSKVVAGDVYGNITINDNYGSLGSMEDMGISSVLSFTAFEGRQISVQIALQEGYYFVGYKHNAYDVVQTNLDNNSFVMIQSFNPNTDYGNYYVVIDKYLIDVELDLEDKIGNYTINGKTKLTNMYVGLKIDLGYEEFSYSAEKGEKFANFYYLKKLDVENRYESEIKYQAYRNKDGSLNKENITNPLNEVTITSALLEKANLPGGTSTGSVIYMGVETTDMFKLDYVIEGEEYAETISVSMLGKDYISGTYVDVGASVLLKIETKAPGKYNIKVTNNKTGEIENKDSLDVTYVLDKNWDIKIEIYPKPFGVIIDENVYKTLTQVNEATPEDVDPANHVNGLQRSGINYNENATMSIVRVTTDRELAEIFITDEKGSFVIVLNGTSYKAYNVKDGKIEDINEDGKIDDNDEINLSEREYSYQITISGNRINIYYITKCDLTVTVNYKLYKEITTA